MISANCHNSSINDSNCTCTSQCGCNSFQSCSTSCCYRILTGLEDGYYSSGVDGGNAGSEWRKGSVSSDGGDEGQWGVEEGVHGSGGGCCGLM